MEVNTEFSLLEDILKELKAIRKILNRIDEKPILNPKAMRFDWPENAWPDEK